MITALGLGFAGSQPVLAAVPCNYGENFDFPAFTAGAASAIGTMPMLDIDRDAATVTVTNGNGGNLPSAITGAAVGPGTNANMYSPALANTANYGRGLTLTGTGGSPGTPLTYTFSKPMRNLVMHIRNGDNQRFTFTDGAGNPLEFTYYFVPKFGSVPTTGTGVNSEFFLQTAPNILAVGENTTGSIAFKNPVTVLKVAQSYIGNTMSAATLNSGASLMQVNFGQYCDQPGVLDFCNNVNFASWDNITYSASVNLDTAVGRLRDETGKAVTVTFSGGLAQGTVIELAGYNNSSASSFTPGTNLAPYRPTVDLLYTEAVGSETTPVVLTWTFSEEVRNPALMLRDSLGTAIPYYIRFYKADGVTPLPFLLRDPASPSESRQLDANTLYDASSFGSTPQFTESTTAIVMKVTRVSGTGSFTFRTQSNLFLGCSGVMTASGSTIDGDSDGDGVPDLTDKCPDTPAGAVVGSDGCPLPTDLSIVKTASVSKITPGVPFDYTITVTNTGAGATNVKASDTVPAGLTINTVTASDSGVVTRNGQSVQAVWAIVPDGASRTLTINVTKP